MEKVTKTSKKVTPSVKKVVIKNAKTTEIKALATEVVEEVSAIDFTENVEKIKDSVMESAKVINNELKATATEIATEVKEMSVEIKKVAQKSVKQIAKKVDVKGNVAKAKKAATKMNKEFTANVEDFKKTSTKLATEMVENMNVADRLETVKKSINNANVMAVKNTSELIDGIEIHATKWQGVAEKAIKTGLKLVDNQSNMMFTTLEAVKSQVGKTSNRFKKLFTV
jgi:hypothetical protein